MTREKKSCISHELSLLYLLKDSLGWPLLDPRAKSRSILVQLAGSREREHLHLWFSGLLLSARCAMMRLDLTSRERTRGKFLSIFVDSHCKLVQGLPVLRVLRTVGVRPGQLRQPVGYAARPRARARGACAEAVGTRARRQRDPGRNRRARRTGTARSNWRRNWNDHH